MLLAAVLMAFVYRWACDRFGHWGSVLAVAVMAWDPNMIAHSQLNTTDLGVTLFAFACMFCVSRLMRRFSWALLFAAGALAGAAMAAKASGVMVLPVVVALLAWPRVRASGTAWSMRRRGLPAAHAASPSLDTGAAWARNAVVVAAVALLTLWASYGFE
jgi:4-amino-4-deoxy-L-arabinose transferase-like glycosyltransferase